MQAARCTSPSAHSLAHSPQLKFSLTQKFLIFFLALLIAKYDQPRSGDQKKKENMGRSYCHVGIQLPQSHSDQTSTVPPPRASNTCSREENEKVTVIGSNTITLGVVEGKPGTISSPSNCPPGFTAVLLPKKDRYLLRHLFSGMLQLGFEDSGSAWQDSEQAPSTPA